MVWEGESEMSEGTTIVATVKVDEAAAREALGVAFSDEELYKLVWAEIDKVNDELPYFKKIKRVILRKEDFDVTTSKKIKRFVTENREGTEI
jgi:hypothetical protein